MFENGIKQCACVNIFVEHFLKVGNRSFMVPLLSYCHCANLFKMVNLLKKTVENKK